MTDAGDAPATQLRWWVRRLVIGFVAVVAGLAQVVGAGTAALLLENAGTPSAEARGGGSDAEWLGHAWVDGRKQQSDLDALAAALRGTGIRDLFVHAGPFANDGTLDPALRPRARWLTDALHAALPGVRVQAWLGAHPVPGQLRLNLPSTRTAVLTSIGQVLDDGFDGVHLDFEPVEDGNRDLGTVLAAAHDVTAGRGAVLSLSASLPAPLPGLGQAAALLPGALAVWSAGYLHRLAGYVDQIAIMAYDTGLPTRSMYSGYVRRATQVALAAVPVGVAVFIGVPAYHDDNLRHHRDAETMAAAVRGVRLALGPHAAHRRLGVAVYVDFAATADDWTAYHHDWSA